jgi:hypothetical protein
MEASLEARRDSICKKHKRRISMSTTPFTFTDMSDAITGYPALSVVLTIEDGVQKSGVGGTSVNVNEIWGFKVKMEKPAT